MGDERYNYNNDKKIHLKLRSYAKLNLSLDVLGLMNDGYHEVATVMQQVSLYDTIDFAWQNSNEFEINIRTTKPYIPTDERNLAYKAVLLIKEKTGFDKNGRLSIDIVKRVPVAAGLGGGSGNAAAVLIGLNRIWKLGLDTKALCEMAKELGADVPFCVLVQNSRYTTALGTGQGEVLEPIYNPFKKYIIITKPAFGVSTKQVFNGIDDCVITERPNTKEMLNAFWTKDETKFYSNIVNVLEEYTLKNYEKVNELKQKVQKTNKVRKVIMSGSGPTIVGIYDTYIDAKMACLEIRKEGYEAYWAQFGKNKNKDFR